MSRRWAASYPRDTNAGSTDSLMILKYPPPASFLNFTSAKSGSTPVVSQSMSRPIVPVGAITVTWALRYPWRSPKARASSHARVACSAISPMLVSFTPPPAHRSWSIGTGRTRRPSHSLASRATPCAARRWLRTTRSMSSRLASKPAKGPCSAASSADCRYDRPVRIADTHPQTARASSES